MVGAGSDLVRRPLVAADVTAFLGLVNAHDVAFFGEPMVDLADLQAEWQVPGHDLATGSRGVWSPEGLVAADTVDPRGRIEVYVATAHQGLNAPPRGRGRRAR